MTSSINNTPSSPIKQPKSIEAKGEQLEEPNPGDLTIQQVATPQIQSTRKAPDVEISRKPTNKEEKHPPAEKKTNRKRKQEREKLKTSGLSKTIQKQKSKPKGPIQKKPKLKEKPLSPAGSKDEIPTTTTTSAHSLKGEVDPPFLPEKSPKRKGAAPPPCLEGSIKPSSSQERTSLTFSLKPKKVRRKLKPTKGFSLDTGESATPAPSRGYTPSYIPPATSERAVEVMRLQRAREQTSVSDDRTPLTPSLLFSPNWAGSSKNPSTGIIQPNHNDEVNREGIRSLITDACNDFANIDDKDIQDIRNAVREGKTITISKGLHEIRISGRRFQTERGHITIRIPGKRGAFHIHCLKAQESEPPHHFSDWEYTHTTWSAIGPTG